MSRSDQVCQMLTLDETTLYYYFLSDDTTSNKRKFSAGINDWAESVARNSKSKSLKSSNKTSSRSASILPLLTNASSRSSVNSVLTKGITISQAAPVPIKVETNDDSILIIDGGISDEDETHGFERDAAVSSPPKGKKRVTSAVSNIHLFLCPI